LAGAPVDAEVVVGSAGAIVHPGGYVAGEVKQGGRKMGKKVQWSSRIRRNSR